MKRHEGRGWTVKVGNATAPWGEGGSLKDEKRKGGEELGVRPEKLNKPEKKKN